VLEPRLIQLDGEFTYQQVAISAVLRALAQSHGVDFAAEFVRDHRAAILIATRRHICGRDQRAVVGETLRLRLAYKDT